MFSARSEFGIFIVFFNTVLFSMSDAEGSNVRSCPNREVVDPSIGAAIQAAVTRSIGF